MSDAPIGTAESIFVGRQPILDRDGHVVAYELLFRNALDAQTAIFAEAGAVAVRVIVDTLVNLGASSVLGSCHGFFNVTGPMLLSEMIEVLPPERVVIELLEGCTTTPELVTRCRELAGRGFTLALDDYVLDDPREDLLDVIQLVKVDLCAVADEDLPRLVRQLTRHDLRLLAEKVETREQFERCHALGFELFQGYFFARPTVIEGHALDPVKTAVLELLTKVFSDVETPVIAEAIKRSPELGISLLRIANSAALRPVHGIRSIDDAINYLGRQQLRRWLMLLLFVGAESGGRSPLLDLAAHRGRFMELVVESGGASLDKPVGPDEAFLVGMVSLFDVVLGRSTQEVIADLGLDDEVQRAVTEHSGPLGLLLELAEAAERADFSCLEDRVNDLGLELASLQIVESQARAWAGALCDAM